MDGWTEDDDDDDNGCIELHSAALRSHSFLLSAKTYIQRWKLEMRYIMEAMKVVEGRDTQRE